MAEVLPPRPSLSHSRSDSARFIRGLRVQWRPLGRFGQLGSLLSVAGGGVAIARLIGNSPAASHTGHGVHPWASFLSAAPAGLRHL